MIKVDPRFYKDDDFNNERAIDCARWNHLVYARTLKCGSEFFYRNFTQTAAWQPIAWQEINWEKDLVFGHVMDPVQRRHKGIAEYLFITGCIDMLLENDDFAHMISQVPCLDEHSACMRDIYGDRVNDLHWIPMSQSDHQLAQRLTDRLLEAHGHAKLEWNTEFVHTTENYLGPAYRKLQQLWEEQEIIGLARFYFQEDIGIYLEALRAHDLLPK